MGDTTWETFPQFRSKGNKKKNKAGYETPLNSASGISMGMFTVQLQDGLSLL